jgi:tartrate dehydratase beta subunit/fumarate hydratase class I family protein
MRSLTIPIQDEDIRSLKVGDPVTLNGVMLTGRDAVHKWLVDTFIKKNPHSARRRYGIA